MDKDNILPAIYGNPTKTSPANNPAVLTKNHQLVYVCIATAKNSRQDLHPEFIKAYYSRLFLCGFFYVNSLEVVNCDTMMDCVGGGLLVSAISPPFALINGSANPPMQTIALRFAPITIVSKLIKETIMSNKTVSGIPSSEHAFGHNPEFHKKLCEAVIPYYTTHTGLVDTQEHLLNNLWGLCNTIKDLVIACNADDDYQIRPETMAGFIDSLLCQIEASRVVNAELWQEVNHLKKDQGGLNK